MQMSGFADSSFFGQRSGDRLRQGIPMENRSTNIHPLNSQVAVITGAGRGIGAAIAKALSQLGATAVLCGRTRSALESVAQIISTAGGKAEVVPCDVTSLQSVEAAARQVDGSLGRVDVLVNNAGIGGFG